MTSVCPSVCRQGRGYRPWSLPPPPARSGQDGRVPQSISSQSGQDGGRWYPKVHPPPTRSGQGVPQGTYPPHPRPGQDGRRQCPKVPTPPPPRPRTCYTVGDMPLAFTQEDFLAHFNFCSKRCGQTMKKLHDSEMFMHLLFHFSYLVSLFNFLLRAGEAGEALSPR